MEIRIMGTCPDKCWYNDKQGQMFTVIEPPKEFCSDEYAYYVEHPRNREGVAYWVWKDDCEVVIYRKSGFIDLDAGHEGEHPVVRILRKPECTNKTF